MLYTLWQLIVTGKTINPLSTNPTKCSNTLKQFQVSQIGEKLKCVCVCVWVGGCVWVGRWVCACVRACVRVCGCVGACVRMHACVRACVGVWVCGGGCKDAFLFFTVLGEGWVTLVSGGSVEIISTPLLTI